MDTAAVDIALLIVRLGLGLTLAAHGLDKFFGSMRIPGVAGWFETIGMKPGRLHAVLAASMEIIAGLLFAAGLVTTFAAAGFVGLMVVAALLVHAKGGFFITSGGWEYTFVLALVPVTTAMIGPGKWSVDELIEISNTESLEGLRTTGVPEEPVSGATATTEASLAEYLDGWWGLIIGAGGGVVAGLLLLAAFYRKPAAGSGGPAEPSNLGESAH